MLKYLLGFFLTILFINANDTVIYPQMIIDNQQEISSMQIHNHQLFVSSIDGELKIYNLNTPSKVQKTITLPKYKDLFDNTLTPKIFNSDTNNLNQTLIIATNAHGSRSVFLSSGNKIEILLSDLSFAKALWINDTQAIIALLSNEILLFDIPSKKIIYQTQISQASFSDMLFDKDTKILYTTGESGIIYAINPFNGTILDKNTIHKDKVFQIALAKQTLFSAGQDRKVGIHSLQKKTSSTLPSNFLIYAVGIDSDGSYLAYMGDDLGSITLFSLKDKKIIAKLKGAKEVINTILFYRDFIIVSCDGKAIYYFNIKGVKQ